MKRAEMSQMTVHDMPFGTSGTMPDRAGGWRPPPARCPEPRDYLAFFVGLPLCFTLWAAAIGMAPAPALGFGNACLYIGTQVMAAWWGNGLGSHAVARLLRAYSPPLWLTLILGFWLMWIPLSIFYQGQHWFFEQIFPTLSHATQGPDFSWSLDYFASLLRYSTPFLPIWMAAVYGYRVLTGSCWFEPSAGQTSGTQLREADPNSMTPGVEQAGAASVTSAPAVMIPARPAFLAGSRIPVGAAICAIKAEEHYIQIWSDNHTDMVRYRFRDALQDLAAMDGAQIHRSWWINWDCVNGGRPRGRSMILTLRNGLVVPVSLAHVSEARKRLGE
jgi:hypothetical protein